MRTLQNRDMTVVAFDYAVYKQERNVLKCRARTITTDYSDYRLEVSVNTSLLATYRLNTSGEVTIDMTDYIRLHTSGSVSLMMNRGDLFGLPLDVDWSVAGLISPSRLFVPDTSAAEAVRALSGIANNYLLPSRILQPLNGVTNRLWMYGAAGAKLLKTTGDAVSPDLCYIYCEFFHAEPLIYTDIVDFIQYIYRAVFGVQRTAAEIDQYLAITYIDTFNYSFRDITFLTQADAELKAQRITEEAHSTAIFEVTDALILNKGDGRTTVQDITTLYASLEFGSDIGAVGIADDILEVLFNSRVQERTCDICYAAVRWVGATGHVKIATWEVCEHKQSRGEVVDIMTVDGSFDTRKGRTDEITLRLDGLTAFDVWYYGDITMSSRVEVSLDGSTWYSVHVDTDGVTVPDSDAGELQELKVNLTFAEYDAVAM